MFQKIKYVFYPLFFLTIFNISLHAVVSISEEFPALSPDQANQLLLQSFQKINTGYKKLDETKGFDYYYRTSFFSPFPLKIFITREKNGSIIRIDSPNRMSFAFADILLQESGKGPFAYHYNKKIIPLTALSTLIHPSLGYLYTYLGSPLKEKKYFMKPVIYLAIDAVLIFVGGKTFFTHGFDPLKRGLIATTALLTTHRLFHLYVNTMSNIAHNRIVELGYTFRY